MSDSAAPVRLQAGMFTSATDEWGTPGEFFAQINAEFGFTRDVCANADNAKVPEFFTKADDGLLQTWTGICWMNPPYGRQIGDWVRKAWESTLDGATVVCLIPARTDTAYWHDYVMRADEIRLVRGRLRFEGETGSATAHNAPFPCAVVVFRPFGMGSPAVSAIGRTYSESLQMLKEELL